MNEKDIQIVMDTKIVQQILKTIPDNMHNQINIIMVNLVSNNDKPEVSTTTIVEKKKGFLGNLFAKSPSPKDIDKAIDKAIEHIPKIGTDVVRKNERYHISKELLEKALESNKWNKTATSKELGIPYAIILRRCSQWGLKRRFI